MALVIFRTKPELKRRVKALAKETKRSTSFYYNLLLEEHLEDLEDIYISEKILLDIRSGKSKTYTAEEVYAEAGLIAKCEANAIPDDQINTEDIPELTEADFARGYFKYLKKGEKKLPDKAQ